MGVATNSQVQVPSIGHASYIPHANARYLSRNMKSKINQLTDQHTVSVILLLDYALNTFYIL